MTLSQLEVQLETRVKGKKRGGGENELVFRKLTWGVSVRGSWCIRQVLDLERTEKSQHRGMVGCDKSKTRQY